MEFCMSESCGKCVPCRAGTVPRPSLSCDIALPHRHPIAASERRISALLPSHEPDSLPSCPAKLWCLGHLVPGHRRR
jgi:hypothetical protein